MYNITNFTAANTIFTMYREVDHINNHTLTAVLMFTAFIIIFMALRNNDKWDVLIADSAIMTIFGILFMVIGLTGWPILVICILMLFFSIFFKVFTNLP